MSMSVDELEGVSLVMAQHMEALSNSILNEIIDRIKEGQTISRTTDYLIWRYSQVYGFDEKVKEFIATATGLMEEELERIFGDVVEKGYARDETLYAAAGKEQVPFSENEELQQYISAVKKQTKDELTNITQTTGYMVNVNGQKVYTPTSYTFQKALDNGVNQVIEGTKDANTAVKEVVKELTDSGLRTVDYATGKHLTVESAARMCVMTGLGQVTGKISEQNMDSLETPYVEVSWHATARPSHQVWQGRVFYWKEKDKNPGNNHLQTQNSSDTMEPRSNNPTISSSINSIERGDGGRGKPGAITHFDSDLNTRQQALLDELPEYDSKVTVSKSDVSMSDLSALTAKTGDEFAMFTKGGERLIIRGDSTTVNITPDEARRLAAMGYKWSGHTHPGSGTSVLMPSDGDCAILEAFNQKRSVIYDSMGNYFVF